MRRVRTKRNENFYFLCFSSFSNLLWLEMKPQWYFFNFFVFFCPFFEIFYYASGRNETKRNDNFLFSLFPILFQPILAWNEFIMVFFNFLNFFLFFWNFLLRVRRERNGRIIVIFSISHPFTTYYGLKWIHNGIFLIFSIFFYFFFNFLLRGEKERNGTER